MDPTNLVFEFLEMKAPTISHVRSTKCALHVVSVLIHQNNDQDLHSLEKYYFAQTKSKLLIMSNSKKALYVGGLADEVDANILRDAFSAFGDILDVNLPMDYAKQKHKGFAFIEFQSPEDAADAIDNMDNSEILGRTIRVNIAKPMRFKENTNRPVWDDDEYLRKVEAEDQTANPAKQHDVKISDDSDAD